MPWENVMSKFKKKELKSGSGVPVKSRKQAIAIMISEKRRNLHGLSPKGKK